MGAIPLWVKSICWLPTAVTVALTLRMLCRWCREATIWHEQAESIYIGLVSSSSAELTIAAAMPSL